MYTVLKNGYPVKTEDGKIRKFSQMDLNMFFCQNGVNNPKAEGYTVCKK